MMEQGVIVEAGGSAAGKFGGALANIAEVDLGADVIWRLQQSGMEDPVF